MSHTPSFTLVRIEEKETQPANSPSPTRAKRWRVKERRASMTVVLNMGSPSPKFPHRGKRKKEDPASQSPNP
jgi:hypothetical protein